MSNLISKECSILSCDDIELNIARETALRYTYTYPKGVELQGIVFLIHGFGAEMAYMKNLREFTAKTFDVLAVDVCYHCFFSRLNNGAMMEFDPDDLLFVQEAIDNYSIDFSGIKEVTVDSVIDTIDKQLGEQKESGKLKNDFQLELSATLIPRNNEYQNFGFMQAIDHINVLVDLEKKKFNFRKDYSISLMGWSHGGYLAHLIAKFAPHKIDTVIDSSSYTRAMLQYVLGRKHVGRGGLTLSYKNLKLKTSVQTYWTLNSNSINCFHDARNMIRDLNDIAHLEVQKSVSNKKTSFISYHSKFDEIARIEEKINFYNSLNHHSFDAALNIVDSKEAIDGKFIKNLSHGMDMSLKELLKRTLSKALKKRSSHKKETVDFTYKCNTMEYQFSFKDGDFKVTIV